MSYYLKFNSNGSALISTLILLALVSSLLILFINMGQKNQLQINQYQKRHSLLMQIHAVEDFAINILKIDQQNSPQITSMNENWGQKIPIFPIGSYRVSLNIEDLQSKLNVNGFIRAKAVMREHNIDFSAMSNTKYYPIVIDVSSFKHLHEFYLIANGGHHTVNPNDQLLYGKVVGGGHTDSKALVDVSTNIYDASENQILGIWRGTTDFTGIVIYVRGGSGSSGSLPGKYKLYTSSDNVTSYTTPATVPTTGSQSVFAIKNDTGADTGVTGEGTSANTG